MRIWVARPEPGATRTAQRLAERGHAALVAPVLAVARTDEAPPAGPFDGVVLTSANGAAALGDLALPPTIPVFAVGTRTAMSASASGFAHVLTADGDAAALTALVRSALAPGSRLLHGAGEDRKAEPAASLAAAGYRVSVWVAYAARGLPALPPEVAAALSGKREPLHAVLHYSRRSAATALALAASAGLEGAFGALAHYCLSADVAVPLVEAGVAVHFVATRPNEDSLLAGLPDAP